MQKARNLIWEELKAQEELKLPNELPAIGTKFRRKKEIKGSIFREGEVTGCEARQDGVWIIHKNGMIRIEAFFDDYEEISQEKPKREEQTDSVDGCAYELKLEVEAFEREDVAIATNIVEDLLLKQLARIVDKASNLLNALEDQNQDFSNPCLPEGRSCPVECDVPQSLGSGISKPAKGQKHLETEKAFGGWKKNI